LTNKIDKQTDEMFETQKVPTRHIPAQPDADYDLLVGELILRFKELEAFIKSVEDDLYGNATDDYIIQGVNGEIYPCKPDIFIKTYDATE
jgi:hypothetical protein